MPTSSPAASAASATTITSPARPMLRTWPTGSGHRAGGWIVNLGEAAEYMFDHNIFQDNLVGVDFCEKMVKETNPGVWSAPKTPRRRTRSDHGYRTIADIMRSLNPFDGEFYREALHVSRYTREMFCLMEGRHVHPSTLYPGGVGTVPTIQLFTDYLVRLMRYVEFMKRVVPTARRPVRLLLRSPAGIRAGRPAARAAGLLGVVHNPDSLRLYLQDDDGVGERDVRYAWRRRRRQAGYHRPGRHQLGHSHSAGLSPTTRTGKTRRCSSPGTNSATRSTGGTRGTSTRSPGRKSATSITRTPGPCCRAGSTARTTCRWTPGGGPIARLWATALAGLVDCGYVQSTGHSVKINLPRTVFQPGDHVRVEDPGRQAGSAAVQRDRAGPGPDLLPGLRGRGGALFPGTGAGGNCSPAGRRTASEYRVFVPRKRSGCGFRAVHAQACYRTTW